MIIFSLYASLQCSYDIPNMMDGGEPILENVEGTEITWKEGKNLVHTSR
jgi:hypothetical protein